ncbi:hypothetical protein ACFOPN_14200 [Xanthomonas hyacinthi]|uniref:hypothetical protein n=1 Tax=Xanthomonas hyacinthi TaxID=56455 RepID=UPI003610B801
MACTAWRNATAASATDPGATRHRMQTVLQGLPAAARRDPRRHRQRAFSTRRRRLL